MSAATPNPTFRDPAGSVSIEGNRVVRAVHADSREYALDFVGSDFYKRLVERGDMVPSLVEDGPDGLRLIHPKIAVPTYPWEWCAAQWQAAADLTLQLCDEGLVAGWILKDATPLNILFVGPQPVLVDVLSFERLDPGTSTWLAYGQYMRTFLLPLLTNKLLKWPLELSLFKRDGYEPIDLYDAMSWGKRLSGSALWPVTLPALLEKRKGSGDAPVKVRPGSKDPQLNLHILRNTVKGLRKSTRKAMPADHDTEWSNYTGNLTHYTVEQSAAKFAWVRGVLEEHKPTTVLDIGANTGEFSKLASDQGAQVVALERDMQSAAKIYNATRSNRTRSAKLNVLTVHADLSRPTPAVGWNNAESTALLPRLAGQFDLVMMLAVIHHILLLEQIPLAAIVELMHGLTRDLLIVEWVPVSDPMFQSLMRGRDDLYGGLTSADLFHACDGRFTLLREETLGNGRVMYLLRKI
jgi:SAM-dependent methyltransferase